MGRRTPGVWAQLRSGSSFGRVEGSRSGSSQAYGAHLAGVRLTDAGSSSEGSLKKPAYSVTAVGQTLKFGALLLLLGVLASSQALTRGGARRTRNARGVWAIGKAARSSKIH
uniref:Uncharacterized protein n=1 Tax=Oryza rufipogon TaxID=4529 RepID=A0A0E0QL87_ORYRU